jgi:hypothetical protein
MKKDYQIWWSKLSPITQKRYQIRHYPATNWEYLTDEMIKDIFNKETINNK